MMPYLAAPAQKWAVMDLIFNMVLCFLNSLPAHLRLQGSKSNANDDMQIKFIIYEVFCKIQIELYHSLSKKQLEKNSVDFHPI